LFPRMAVSVRVGALACAISLLAGCGDGPTEPAPAQRAEKMALNGSAWIGASGGTLDVGPYTVSFPPDAVAEVTLVELTQVESGAWPIELTPHGLAFATPVTLTIHAEGESDPAGLHIYWFNPDTEAWEAQPSQVSGNDVSAELAHFSRYGLW